MRMLAVAACLAAFVSVTVGSAPAEAQQCAPGSYPSVDSFGNQVCKRFSDQSTSAAQGRRCIIPAISICEWTGPQGSKTKHMITRADGAPLFLAGLWASHTWEDERTESYTMVMQDTAPGDDMHIFHNRQPVVLDPKGRRPGSTAAPTMRR